MEFVLANARGKPRRERLNGRDCLVTSATLIVGDSILNGSRGPGFYPKEECDKNPLAWNGMPLVLWHPQANGNHITARDPEVLNEYGLGTVFNADSDGRLTSECWFDIELVKRADNRFTGKKGFPLLPKIENGEKIELSTGLFPEYEEIGGVHNGEEYSWTARNLQPDHVAILPDQRGACSVEDGCGVNNAAAKAENKRSIWQRLGKLLGVYNEEEEEQTSDTECSCDEGETCEKCMVEKKVDNAALGQPKSEVSGKYKKVNAGTGKGPVHEAAQDGFFGGKCKECGEPLVDGKCLHCVITDSEQPTDTDIAAATNQEGEPMNRAQRIQFLVANCDCWRGKQKVLENAEAFSDDDLKKLVDNVQVAKKNEIVANAARKGLTVKLGKAGERKFVFNEEKGSLVPLATQMEEEEEEEEEYEDEEEVGAVKKPMAGNQMTEEQWLKTAPPSVRESFLHARQVLNQTKLKIVRQLVGNIADPERRKAIGNKLLKESVEQLQERLELMPAVNSQDQLPPANWIGAGGGPSETPVYNQADDNEDVSDMTPPTINWEKEAEVLLNRRAG